MSRLQSILTGIATAVAAALVVVSIDFGRLVASFQSVTAGPVALAVVLLALNFVLAFLRFEWTLGALGVTLDRRNAAYAFALGNLACSTTARVRLWPMMLSRNWLARLPSANA